MMILKLPDVIFLKRQIKETLNDNWIIFCKCIIYIDKIWDRLSHLILTAVLQIAESLH